MAKIKVGTCDVRVNGEHVDAGTVFDVPDAEVSQYTGIAHFTVLADEPEAPEAEPESKPKAKKSKAADDAK